jgi:hypothetical protein
MFDLEGFNIIYNIVSTNWKFVKFCLHNKNLKFFFKTKGIYLIDKSKPFCREPINITLT